MKKTFITITFAITFAIVIFVPVAFKTSVIEGVVKFIPIKLERGSSIKLAEVLMYYGSIFGGITTIIAVWITIEYEKKERKKDNIEKFFFESLNMYNSLVSELEILVEGKESIKGKRIFISLRKEYIMALQLLNDLEKQSLNNNGENNYSKLLKEKKILKKDKKRIKCEIAYLILLFGVGKTSDTQLRIELKRIMKEEKIKFLITKIKERKEEHKKEKDKGCKSFSLLYTPFQGHQSKLGHYYRFLYQIVKYVDGQKLLDYKEKYEMIKFLRTQLSIYEQELLGISALSSIGKAWADPKKKLIESYKLIKNVPKYFSDEDNEEDRETILINFKDYFPKIIFEDEEDDEDRETTPIKNKNKFLNNIVVYK